MEESYALNLLSWDERAPAHAASPDYAVQRFVDDPAFLSDVVRFDLPRLGDLAGLDVLHLQCHIGTDTVSLARLGARTTGLDFSPAALVEARRIAGLAGVDVEWVEGRVDQAVDLLGEERFDVVFTGIGALGWLPRISEWADVVVRLLRPGGRLFLREGHPVLWAVDDTREDRLLVLDLPYWEMPEPLVWDEGGTYVETDAQFQHNRTHEWNHGLGEIVTALLDRGLRLTQLVEHDSVPWQALPDRMVQGELGEWRLRERPERLPLSYTLQAVKD